MDEAIRFATAVSAITVSRAGASASIPTRAEVDEFLKNQAE
jgi:sugar/nucleoside kinase (ribokinase family)